MRTAYKNLVDTATTVTASTQLTNNPVSNVRDGRLTTKWISDTTTTQSVVVELPTFPEYPDNVAGTKYIQDAWATTDGWATDSASAVTVLNGMLRFRFDAYKVGTGVVTGSTVIAKVQNINATATTFYLLHAGATVGSALTSLVIQPNAWATLSAVATTSDSVVVFINNSALYGNIDWFYVGNGNYDSLALDASGNDNHGSVFGCTPVAGITGRALSFDKINDYFVTPVFAMPDIYTFRAMLINHVRDASFIQLIMGFGNPGAGRLTLYRDVNNDNLVIVWWDGSAKTTSISNVFSNTANAVVDFGFTITWATGAYTVWKNGVSFATGTLASIVKPANFALYVGTQQTVVTPSAFGGTIDDPRIYNRALSQAEITSLYNQEPFASEMLGLVGWWKLDKDYHVNTAAILGHNIKSGTTVKIQANNSDVWGDPELSETFTYVASDATILRFLDEVKVYKYWRFSFTGQASVEAGRLWLGEYMTINPASLLDFTVTKKRSDVVIYGRDRQKFANPGVGWRRFSLKFPASDKAMIYKVEQMYDAVGQHTSFIFCNFDTSREWPLVEPVYCSFDNDLDFTHTQRQKYSYTLNIEEDK
jgi:hypothetical protein